MFLYLLQRVTQFPLECNGMRIPVAPSNLQNPDAAGAALLRHCWANSLEWNKSLYRREIGSKTNFGQAITAEEGHRDRMDSSQANRPGRNLLATVRTSCC